MLKLNLEWTIIDRTPLALIFDTITVAAFQAVADARGIETSDMMAKALAELLGPIMATRSKD